MRMRRMRSSLAYQRSDGRRQAELLRCSGPDTCLRSSLFITTDDAVRPPSRSGTHTHAHSNGSAPVDLRRVHRATSTKDPTTLHHQDLPGHTTTWLHQSRRSCSRVALLHRRRCSYGAHLVPALGGRPRYVPHPARILRSIPLSRVLIHQHSRSAYKATEPPTSELARTILMISLLFKGRAITEPQKAQLKARRTTDQQTARPR